MATARLRREEHLTGDDLATLLADNPGQAAKAILSAARDGVLTAQTLLGQLLLDGRGIQRDPALAVTWFRIAAQQGDAMAHNMLGRCLEHGWGCDASAQDAARHFKHASDAGLDWGQYNYANLLATGRGVAKDLHRAFALYQRAAEQGHAKSMNLLGRFFEDGVTVPADPATALQWYRRSAIAGDFRGQYSLAGMLAAQGFTSEAEAWLRKALEGGNLNFLRATRAALWHASPSGFKQIGRDYYRRAAELGDDSDRALYAGLRPCDAP